VRFFNPKTPGRRSSWLRALVYGWAKHKLRTGPWVVLTGNGPLCMSGCGVREIFSACVRRLQVTGSTRFTLRNLEVLITIVVCS
jgi:hypothetical protein